MQKNIGLSIVLALVIGVMALMSSGCDEGTGLADRDPGSTPTPTPAPATVEEPLNVAIAVDQSESTTSTRTEQPNLEVFQPLIERNKRTGGEIGLTLIRDRSNRPLLRLRIEPPPIEPRKPDEKGNAYEVAKELDRYDAEQKTYQAKYKQWQEETESRIKSFTEKATPLLAQRADAQATDLFNALARADLFLAERDLNIAPSAYPLKIILLVSDCQDNVNAPVPALKSTARVIIANGIGSRGALEKLDPPPLQFESVAAAIRFIVATKGE